MTTLEIKPISPVLAKEFLETYAAEAEAATHGVYIDRVLSGVVVMEENT